MARKNRYKNRGARDLIPIANDPLTRELLAPLKLTTPLVTPSYNITNYDRRRFTFDKSIAISTSGQQAPAKKIPGKKLSKNIAFNRPSQVPICARRKQRRAVIFAKKQQRKGRRGKRNYNQWSDIRC